jgi:hypothetical protein
MGKVITNVTITENAANGCLRTSDPENEDSQPNLQMHYPGERKPFHPSLRERGFGVSFESRLASER